jgi:CheY-like chemotaxis protein
MHAKQKHILLFDDDYTSMSPLKRYLENDMGFQIELTANQNILQRLGEESFDLICVDLMIHPTSFDAEGNEVKNVHFDEVNWQKTGLAFLQRLRSGEFSGADGRGTSPEVPVIVLSAVAGYSVEDELGQNIQVNSYVEKPFALQEITGLICNLLKE